MREIKFRGMATEDYETSTDGLEKGDWVEGYYYFSFEHNCPMIMTRLGAECGGVGSGLVDVDIPIDIKTLGQFTGLKDKNGKEIFEGDVFNCIYHSDGCVNHIFVVSYSSEATRFYLSRRGDHCQQPAVRQTIGDVARYCSIGNIHENPDLLK